MNFFKKIRTLKTFLTSFRLAVFLMFLTALVNFNEEKVSEKSASKKNKIKRFDENIEKMFLWVKLFYENV